MPQRAEADDVAVQPGAAPSAREAALREILEVISRSRNDEQPVFEAILRKAAELCGAPLAGLNIISEDRSHAVMVAHWGDRLRALAPGKTVWPMNADIVPSIAMREGRVVQERDLADTDGYRSGEPVRRQAVDEEGIRTIVVVPLFSGGRTVGSIALYRREVRPFSADEIALVETFAAQAVIAIENVRQFRELQTRLAREAATREILEVISRNPDDDRPVFDVILRNAIKLCAGNTSALLMGRKEDSRMTMAAWRDRESGSSVMDDAMIAQMNATDMLMDPAIHVSAQAIVEARNIHVFDTRQHPSYLAGEPSYRIMADALGVRSILIVPLIDSRGALGVVHVHRREVRPFSDDEIALVETFAAQAVIAIENVRQFRELQTRLVREKASAEILELISRNRDDEQPVFEAILRRAADLCDTPAAALVLAKAGETHVRLVAQYGVDPATVALYDRGEVPMDPDISFAARAILTGEVVHLDDMMATENYRNGVRLTVTSAQNSGVRTIMFVPLITATGAIGSLDLFRTEVRPYRADEIALVETFAAQAVIAIENVRQFRELQTRLAREAATREILEVISRSRDDEKPVFDVVLRKAAELCHAPMASLVTISEDRSHAILAADWGVPVVSGGLRVGETVWSMNLDGAISTCMREGRVVDVHDLADTDSYRSGKQNTVTAVDVEGIRTLLAVPLFSGGQTVACILVFRQEIKPFTPDDIALVETFAAQAVIAIENVRQFKALERLNAELGDRVHAQVGEIERMGRLRRFLSPAVADAVVSGGNEKLLGSHRALLGVLFCDIRGFTAFCETAEPEETIEVLQTYHEEMGRLIEAHGAGVDHRMGDGIMVLFNDPLPCDDPAGAALRLAMAMRERMAALCTKWKRMGHRLGFGVGVSLGYATVGMVGSGGRFDYTASGTAVNLAARLCDEAADGEILLSPRAFSAVEDTFAAASRGEVTFKGIQAPVEVFRVTGPRGA